MKLFGLVAKRFCTVGWGLVGVIVIGVPAIAGHVAVDPSLGGSPDNVFALASGSLLPVILRGVMVASILAAVMSVWTPVFSIMAAFWSTTSTKNISSKTPAPPTIFLSHDCSLPLACYWAG